MDLTCADAIGMVAKDARRNGGRLILCGVRPGVHAVLQRAGIVSEVGEDAIFLAEPTKLGSTHKAIEFANELAGPRGCGLRSRRD